MYEQTKHALHTRLHLNISLEITTLKRDFAIIYILVLHAKPNAKPNSDCNNRIKHFDADTSVM